MSTCPSFERLQALLADQLSRPEAEEVEAHVENCADCQKTLERLTGAVGSQKEHGPPSRWESGEDFLRRLERLPLQHPWPIGKQFQPARGRMEEPSHPAREQSTEPTWPYLKDDEGPEKKGRGHVALVAGSVPHSTGEVRDLLRKRFRIGGLIGTGAFVFFVIDVTSAYFRGHGLSLVQWLITAEFWCILVMLAVSTAILWSRLPLSLSQLRGMETVLMGVFLTHLAWIMWLDLHFGGSLDRALAGNQAPWSRSVHDWAFPFFVLIVLYGTFIPNTGGRCLLVVSIMAIIPVSILAVAGLATGAALSGKLGFLLLYLAMFMGIAVTAAAYGSHRIEVLRQQASEARKLGQYQLKQLLGVGGMGEVYLAEHVLLKRPCAIKVIRPERAGDPKNLLRFEREVRATATLRHPNTVEIFDYGHAADGTFYYVMEYLTGLSLEQLVHEYGPLPPARAVHLLRQVCGALQEAHDAGLIHRDIKPANILVCQRGGLYDVAKLLDFGLVQAPTLPENEQKLTQEGAIAGTPAYMSPEQAASRGDLDARSDLYSLGTVAYFLLTGKPPFVRGTAVQTLAAHLSEPVASLDSVRAEVPADLQAVVLRCLEKKPARRFQDADALEQALAQCDCADQWTRENAKAWWVSDFLIPKTDNLFQRERK